MTMTNGAVGDAYDDDDLMLIVTMTMVVVMNMIELLIKAYQLRLLGTQRL
jgi:hypothetical protein